MVQQSFNHVARIVFDGIEALSRFALAAVAVLIVGIRPGIAAADLSKTMKFNIGPQELPSALLRYSEQSGVQVTSASEVIEGKSSAGAVGSFPARVALERILQGTELAFEVINPNTIAIVPASQPPAPAPSSAETNRRTTLWQRLRLAQVDENSATPETPVATGERKPSAVEEVLVTAQKRKERLQDVPVPVTAIGAGTLVDSNQLQLQDYYARVPGLNLTDAGVYGGSIISIRGISSSVFNDGTVGIVVDDVPFGSTSAIGPGEVVPEIDPSELARIEVLRGPQGTLYGASSMGGLLKYVTVDPDTGAFAGRVQAGISGIRNGDRMGHSVRGSVNVPLSETWAIRASGFTRHDSGYIDDPVHDIEGVNRGRVSGGRVSVLWQPTDHWALKLGAMLQDSETHGNSYVNPIPGFTELQDLQQSTVPGSGGYRKELQVYSANLTADLGRVDVTSVSAYSVNENVFLFDLTPTLSALANRYFQVAGAPSIQYLKNDRFTQEIRLTAALGSRIEWLFGVFYDRENTPQNQSILAADFDTGVRVGELGYADFSSRFEEYAAFTDFTFQVTDRFDVQLGVRGSENEQTLRQSSSGLILPTVTRPDAHSEDRSFTYLVTPRLRLSPDLMMYARLASGYRPGGPNTLASLGVPPEFGPDKTQNYEIGIKADVFDHALSLDASVYHIDWKDVLISLREPRLGAGYKANAGRARSRGVDLSIEARPLTGMTIAASGAWNEAELTEDFPPTSTVVGLSGDRLPFSSRFSGSVSVDQEFSVTAAASAFVGISMSYVGDRQGVFVASAQREIFPSYVKMDVRGGVRYGPWTTSFFANNLADKRGVLNGGAVNLYPNSFIYIQPRTVGMSLARTF